MKSFDNYILLKEDYKSQLQAFQRQGVAEDIALTYLNTHKIIKQLFGKSLTPQQNNIDSFKKFDDLKDLIHTLRHDTPNFDNKIAKESINLAQTRFKGQSINKQTASPKLIQDTLNAFVGTVSSFPQSFPFPKNNINSYKNIEEVKTALDNFKAPENQPPTQEDESSSFFPNEDEDFDVIPEKAKTIYDDNQLAIYLALSPDACISIKGKHPTNWCIARDDTSTNAYYGYRTQDTEPTFYFVKNKKKIEEEGPNPIHQKYKDPHHFFVIQVTKDNKYKKTNANNPKDENVTWEEIVETEPLLANKKELFKWFPLTKNEALAKSMKKGIDAETFKNYSIKKKIMYVQTGKLSPAIWNMLNDDLTLLAINRFKITEPYQIFSLRDRPKLYKRWLDTAMERQGVMFAGQDDTIPISVHQEINDNFSSNTIQNLIKQYNIDLKKTAIANRKAIDDIWNTFNDEDKLNIALKIQLTPKQLNYIKSNDKLFEKLIILAIKNSKLDPYLYSFVSDNIVKDIFEGNLEETEKLIQEKYRNIFAKLTPAFLDPLNMSNVNYGKIQGSVLDSLAHLFNFIRTHNNFVQAGYIKQGNIFEKELPNDQEILTNMLFDYINFYRGLGRKREDWYKQYAQYLREFCNDIHASATIIIKYCDSIGTVFRKNLQKLLNLCSNYKPKTYEPFQEPNKKGNRFSNESLKSFKVWLEKLELTNQAIYKSYHDKINQFAINIVYRKR